MTSTSSRSTANRPSSDRPAELRLRAARELVAPVRDEAHREVAHEPFARRRDFDALAADRDQALTLLYSEPDQILREMLDATEAKSTSPAP